MLCFIVGAFQLFAGEGAPSSSELSLREPKGTFFFFWGYNRSSYAKSDIKLIGPDYNFTLSGVKARDLPKKFTTEYFNPSKFTIPQFNFRVGYFINDKYAIAGGWDHMKYQTVDGLEVKIDGYIESTASVTYAGDYNDQTIRMDHNGLIKMEHSDGLNIVNLNLERHDYLYPLFDEKLAIKLVTGAGLGVAMPWTNSFVFGARNDDRVHFSGLGAQLFIAPEVVFFNRVFARATWQVGFTRLWDIAITPKSDKSNTHAEQSIWYETRSIVVGYRINLIKP